MNKYFYQFGLMATLSLFLASCQNNQATVQEAIIPVEIEEVVKAPIGRVLNVSGNVDGQKTVRMGFLVSGKVNRIEFEEGQVIHKGQLLASLDAKSYQLARDIAKAKYDEIKDEYDRLSQLRTSGSISESDFIKIQAGYEQAKAHYELQEKNFSDTKLIAPISGVILKKGLQIGEIIGSGIPAFAISNIDTVQVKAGIPEGELQWVHIGDTAEVVVPSLNTTFQGLVTVIGAAADPTTRTFNIKIDVANADGVIKPGMIANIEMLIGLNSEEYIVSPKAVIKDIDNTYYVFVADTKKGKAYKRKVIVNGLSGNQITIVSGLNTGEYIVVGGQNNLVDGSTISVNQ